MSKPTFLLCLLVALTSLPASAALVSLNFADGTGLSNWTLTGFSDPPVCDSTATCSTVPSTLFTSDGALEIANSGSGFVSTHSVPSDIIGLGVLGGTRGDRIDSGETITITPDTVPPGFFINLVSITFRGVNMGFGDIVTLNLDGNSSNFPGISNVAPEQLVINLNSQMATSLVISQTGDFVLHSLDYELVTPEPATYGMLGQPTHTLLSGWMLLYVHSFQNANDL